ncbi:hypothetical protein DPM19_04085 [Actinomadura craniellae]|uniref:Uncharacterized protein n=1 Tax=Actinomadura craniellae TaxID=2231787 RepID=A0A365HBP5_9ACTN|nr:hypothetical protein DPM19_04085 [Actinomadura craniellae]
MWRVVAWAIGAGLAVGVLTNIGQGLLPGVWNQFVNSGAVWVVAAFVTGLLLPGRGRWTVIAGVGTQAGAVVGYYGYAELVRDGMGDLYAPAVWLAAALVAGPIFATAGSWTRGDRRSRRVLGAAVLGGVFLMEAIRYQWVLEYTAEAGVFAALGLLLPLLPGRTGRDRWQSVLAALPLGLVAFGVEQVLLAIVGL